MSHYQLIETKDTELFYLNIVESAEKYINSGYPAAKAVARSLYQKAGKGGYFFRSLCGGKYAIEKVINKGPNCIDYSETAKKILKKYFNIESQIKETRLVSVRNHQYLITENREVLDLMIGIPEFSEGYFAKEEIYHEELNKINRQKNKLFFKQIKSILFPKTRKKLC